MARSGLSRSVLPASTNEGKAGQQHGTHPHRGDARGYDRRLPRVSAKHNLPQDIDGLLAWAASTNENGLQVVTVSQSKAHQDRWAAEQLSPAFQSLGMTDVASNMEFTEYDADELYIR